MQMCRQDASFLLEEKTRHDTVDPKKEDTYLLSRVS